MRYPLALAATASPQRTLALTVGVDGHQGTLSARQFLFAGTLACWMQLHLARDYQIDTENCLCQDRHVVVVFDFLPSPRVAAGVAVALRRIVERKFSRFIRPITA